MRGLLRGHNEMRGLLRGHYEMRGLLRGNYEMRGKLRGHNEMRGLLRGPGISTNLTSGIMECARERSKFSKCFMYRNRPVSEWYLYRMSDT